MFIYVEQLLLLYKEYKHYMQDTVESMVRSAQDKCPNVLSEEKVVNDVRAACLAKSQVKYSLNPLFLL